MMFLYYLLLSTLQSDDSFCITKIAESSSQIRRLAEKEKEREI